MAKFLDYLLLLLIFLFILVGMITLITKLIISPVTCENNQERKDETKSENSFFGFPINFPFLSYPLMSRENYEDESTTEPPTSTEEAIAMEPPITTEEAIATEPPTPEEENRFKDIKFVEELFNIGSIDDITTAEYETIINLPILKPTSDNLMSSYFSTITLNDIYQSTPEKLIEKTSYLAYLYFALEIPQLTIINDPDTNSINLVFLPISTIERKRIIDKFLKESKISEKQKQQILYELNKSKFENLGEEVSKAIKDYVWKQPDNNTSEFTRNYALIRNFLPESCK